MRAQLAKWRTAFASDPDAFRKVYRFTYDLGRQDGAKVIGAFSLPPPSAPVLLLSARRPAL